MTFLPLTAAQYPLQQLTPGWRNAEVTIQHSNGMTTKRYEIIDSRCKPVVGQRTRYLHEPMAMVAFKCFLLFIIGLPVYFLAYTAFHFMRLPIFAMAHPTAFVKQVEAIARIPLYFIALECAAFYGIFHPLGGRALFGGLESGLHDGKSRRKDIRYEKNDVPILPLCWQALTEEEHKYTFFAGFCMQPIGKENDPNVVQVLVCRPQTLPNV